jgi:hypothetical protein
VADVHVLETMAVSTLKGGGDTSFGGYQQDPSKHHFGFLVDPGLS